MAVNSHALADFSAQILSDFEGYFLSSWKALDLLSNSALHFAVFKADSYKNMDDSKPKKSSFYWQVKVEAYLEEDFSLMTAVFELIYRSLVRWLEWKYLTVSFYLKQAAKQEHRKYRISSIIDLYLNCFWKPIHLNKATAS